MLGTALVGGLIASVNAQEESEENTKLSITVPQGSQPVTYIDGSGFRNTIQPGQIKRVSRNNKNVTFTRGSIFKATTRLSDGSIKTSETVARRTVVIPSLNAQVFSSFTGSFQPKSFSHTRNGQPIGRGVSRGKVSTNLQKVINRVQSLGAISSIANIAATDGN